MQQFYRKDQIFIQSNILQYYRMVQGTFVLSAFRIKDDNEKRIVESRQNGAIKYLVVVIAIFVVFGCEYCFDNPSALQVQIEHNYQKDHGVMSESQFNLLYSLYAFPNIIIPLIGGILIDKIGARVVLIITSTFCVLGQAIFGFGGYSNLFSIMLVGRIIFGIGGEVLHASQNTLISNWFKASQLSMVLGICLSFPKMGSSLNSYVSSKVGESYAETQPNSYLNVAIPIFIGLIIMAISLSLAILLAYIDRKTEEKDKINHQSKLLSSQRKISSQYRRSQQGKKSSKLGSEIKVVETSEIDLNEKQAVEGGDHLNLKQIKNLPLTFWLIILISMFAEALFIPFLDNANAYYQIIFDIKSSQAGLYLIMPYCVSSLFVVILGYIVDKIKKRSNVVIASCSFITITYLIMMIIETEPTLNSNEIVRWIPSFLLGLCIAIFCAILVPTVPMLVNPKLLGTGFGIMEMLQNFALGVFPLLAGALRESKGENKLEGFHFQTLFFFLISCLCTGISIILKSVDLTTGNRLDVKDFRKKYLEHFLHEKPQNQ